MSQQPLEQFYEYPEDYASTQMNENMYELPEIRRKEEKKGQQSFLSTPGLTGSPNVAMGPKQRQSSWSKPLLLITVLLCLILILLIIILGIVVYDKYATGNNVECTNTATGASSSSNTNEWADRIAQIVYDKLDGNPNFTEPDEQILQTTRDSAQKLINIVNTLSNLQDTSTSTAGVVDDILLIAQELLVLHNESTALPTSCKEIKEKQPLSSSGLYQLASRSTNAAYTTYCNMGTLCGSGGGWTRLAYLDMSDATQNCPSGFRLYQSGGVRACGRPNQGAGCTASVQFPSNGISYSQICGRVTGYQIGGPDAIHSQVTNVNLTYLDGVSITHGSSRQHIWSLMAAPTQHHNRAYSCPCSTGSTRQVPSFIGSHYFCESGNPTLNVVVALYTADPLWDGQGCGDKEVPCCNAPGIPWFHRDYGTAGASSDYIELRVCSNEGIDDEDTPVSFIEIYVS
uniref:Uncharacterized protein n=1 Tax=Amphimedon queenslandica TaxID=400682 RepID=A0A1X7UBY8_AMPQE